MKKTFRKHIKFKKPKAPKITWRIWDLEDYDEFDGYSLDEIFDCIGISGDSEQYGKCMCI